MTRSIRSVDSKKVAEKTKLAQKTHITKVVIGVAVVLFVINLLTGGVSYGFMTALCLRPPVVASKFAASWSYSRPGQSGYGPHMFGEYYCTEQDAKNAGFNPSPW